MRRFKRVSRAIRKRIEHKRFLSFVSSFLIVAISMVSFTQSSLVFGQSEVTIGATIATEEVILTTKKTSRAPIVGNLSQGFHTYHPGIDIEKPFGEPIYPFLSGVVFETGFNTGGYGKYVVIDHKNGYFSLYAHLDKILVEKDNEVSQDTIIGNIGVTGRSTGSHLHLEIYENGIAVNPLTILPAFPSSASGRFTGGPSALPSRTLSLPLNTQQASISESQVAKKEDAKEEKNKEQDLGIWRPSELVQTSPKPVLAPADSKVNHLLPKLDLP